MVFDEGKYHYDKGQLVRAFQKIGLKKGDIVFCHSNIGFLGYPKEGREPEKVFNTILDAFFEVLGSEGTLIVPTFTYSFCKGEVFDIDNSPSTVGLFTEFIRKHPKAIRSVEPIFSVSAIGFKAQKLLSDISNECFGLESVWDRLFKEDAAILNIGVGVGSTFIHYVEQMLKVSYRYKKLFTGEVIEKGRRRKTGIIYFVRDLTHPGANSNWKNLERDARTDGSVKFEVVGKGEVNLIRCQKMFELCRDGLKKNPSYLVDGLEKKDGKEDRTKDKSFNLTPESSMMEIIEKLWKLPRDIISDGYDVALYSLSEIVDMRIHKYPTGTEFWTWIIPEKWTCHEAYLETLDGKRLFSYTDNPLHVISYSLPIEKIVSRDELFEHLYTHENPEAIPYICKYYERDWGLCCSKVLKDSLADEKYKVVIKIDFSFGELKVGEVIIPGEIEESIVLCAHLCHPGMVNDDLTGVVVGIEVMKELKKKAKLQYTYRFLIVPETIGSIAYLSQNDNIIPKLKYGIFLEMLGNNNTHAFQLSRQGNTRLDRIARYVMKRKLSNFREGPFRKIICNDEMVFNGPGVDIPMISISRFPYPEYHTSYDTPDIISEKNLEESKNLILEILNVLDNDWTPKRKFEGPVFLSRYGLWVDWRTNQKLNENIEQIMLRLEGYKSIFDIAEELNMDFYDVLNYMNRFYEEGLIEKI